jgi:hypothetical protein
MPFQRGTDARAPRWNDTKLRCEAEPGDFIRVKLLYRVEANRRTIRHHFKTQTRKNKVPVSAD